jgi:hypothetical protein
MGILELITLTIALANPAPEDWPRTTNWPPQTPGTYYKLLQPGQSFTLISTDTVTGSTEQHEWTTCFATIRDTVTTHPLNNTGGYTITINYHLTDNQGWEKFTGQSTGTVHKRDRTLWSYKILVGAGGD